MLERRRPFETDRALAAAGAMLVAGAVAALALSRDRRQALRTRCRRSSRPGWRAGRRFYKRDRHGCPMRSPRHAGGSHRHVFHASEPGAGRDAGGGSRYCVNLRLFWRWAAPDSGSPITLFGDLCEWSTPEWLIWVLLATGFGLFIPIERSATIALDVFICCARRFTSARASRSWRSTSRCWRCRRVRGRDLLYYGCSAGAGGAGLRRRSFRYVDRFPAAQAAQPGGAAISAIFSEWVRDKARR